MASNALSTHRRQKQNIPLCQSKPPPLEEDPPPPPPPPPSITWYCPDRRPLAVDFESNGDSGHNITPGQLNPTFMSGNGTYRTQHFSPGTGEIDITLTLTTDWFTLEGSINMSDGHTASISSRTILGQLLECNPFRAEDTSTLHFTGATSYTERWNFYYRARF